MSNTDRDTDLLDGIRNGDPAALNTLIDRYREALRRQLWEVSSSREDIEDALQDTWICVAEKSGRFKEGMPIWPWLRQIAVNRLRTIAARRDPVAGAADIDLVDDRPSAYEMALVAERLQRLRAVIGCMSPLLKIPLTLRYYGQLSESEIARNLGLPLGTVRSRIGRAMAHLRNAMRDRR